MTQTTEWEEIDEEQLAHQQIEKRAYELYLQHNGEGGHELEDWLTAEEEVKQGEPRERWVPMRTKVLAASQQRTR